MEKAVIAANTDAATNAIVRRLARERGQSVGDVAGDLLHDAAIMEDRLIVASVEGLRDIDAGNIVPHNQVMIELDAMIARHRARCPD